MTKYSIKCNMPFGDALKQAIIWILIMIVTFGFGAVAFAFFFIPEILNRIEIIKTEE